MVRLVLILVSVVLASRLTNAQFGYNTGGYGSYPNYGYSGYGSYPYGYQYPSSGYYPSYPSYGYPSTYPYYPQSQQGYNPNSYYGNGLNQAYATSSGGTATAQATSGGGYGTGGYGTGGYFG